MIVNNSQLLSTLATTPLPSSSIANNFNVSGYENNSFLRDWAMLVNALFLVNRENYRGQDLGIGVPIPSPYSFRSPSSDKIFYTVKVDLDDSNLSVAPQTGRHSKQPFNGITGGTMNLGDYASILGATLDNCPWLLTNFDAVSPLQFIYDSARCLIQMSQGGIGMTLTNKSTVFLATINVSFGAGNPQVPRFADILVED